MDSWLENDSILNGQSNFRSVYKFIIICAFLCRETQAGEQKNTGFTAVCGRLHHKIQIQFLFSYNIDIYTELPKHTNQFEIWI